ncbi:hypothetical protein SPRG_17410, partial [Saprolegnia parasitica CBS 223.65]
MRHNDSSTVDVSVIGPKTLKGHVLTGYVTGFASGKRNYAPSFDATHVAAMKAIVQDALL